MLKSWPVLYVDSFKGLHGSLNILQSVHYDGLVCFLFDVLLEFAVIQFVYPSSCILSSYGYFFISTIIPKQAKKRKEREIIKHTYMQLKKVEHSKVYTLGWYTNFCVVTFNSLVLLQEVNNWF